MIDIDIIRKRIAPPVPTRTPIPKGNAFFVPEPRWIREVEAHNRWLDEWEQDRKDLHVALKELEELRQAHPSPYR